MYNDTAANDYSTSEMTVFSYLGGLVNFPVSAEGVRSILARRGLDSTDLYAYADAKVVELATADLYAWIATSPYRVGSVTDSDNGWTHASAGWTLSDADRRYYLKLANAIYDKYDESPVGRSRIRITDHGIKHGNRPLFGFRKKYHSR